MKTKRLLSIILFAAIFAGLFAGCAKKDDGRLKVICTLFPQYDFVRAIAGDKVNAELLLKPGFNYRTFMPDTDTFSDIADSDLFIYTNDYAEPWVPQKMDAIKRKQAFVLNASNGILLDIDLDHEENDETGDAEHKQAYEPHVWTVPANAIKMVDNISAELCRMDAANAELYKANTAAYKAKLTALDTGFRDAVTNGKRKIIVMADRFTLQYFVKEYTIGYLAALGANSELTQPDAAVVTKMVEAVKKQGIPVVFYREMSDKKMAEEISAQTGAQMLLFHSCENLSKEETQAGETYLSIMQSNLENLRVALG